MHAWKDAMMHYDDNGKSKGLGAHLKFFKSIPRARDDYGKKQG
jgi:hypothetical protein